jgi:integrase
MTKRGFGGVYKRGSIYWIRYWHRGQEFRESSGSANQATARQLLKQRIQETGRPGRFIGPSQERVTFEDLVGMVRTDYSINRFRSAEQLACRIAHLTAAFANVRAIDITRDRIQSYIADRQQSGASNASVNRELAILKRAFHLAIRAERLAHAPHIAMLAEPNARQGFVESGEFRALRAQLPEYLRDPVSFLYLTGWRLSEMRTLEWRDVTNDAIRLRAEHSKNQDSRELPFSLLPELGDIIARARHNRRLDCRFVFQRNAKQLRDFRTSWANACAAANLGHILVHDLRRTAVRNLVRANVPEAIAMQLTGHRSRRIFERYNIVSAADKQTAMAKLAAYLDAQSTTPTVVPLTGDSSNAVI